MTGTPSSYFVAIIFCGWIKSKGIKIFPLMIALTVFPTFFRTCNISASWLHAFFFANFLSYNCIRQIFSSDGRHNSHSHLNVDNKSQNSSFTKIVKYKGFRIRVCCPLFIMEQKRYNKIYMTLTKLIIVNGFPFF